MKGGRAFAGIAAQALLEQVGRARRLLGRVRRGEDPEAVHDLRVASRRIRAALALLRAAGLSRARAWRRGVRRLTRALGRARDLDVRLGFLRDFLRRSRRRRGPLPPELSRLEKRLEEERGSVQRKVLRALRRLDRSGVLRAAGEWARRAALAARPRDRAARAAAARHVGRRLRAVLELASCVPREDAADRHHLLRIAVKRLRYALEILRPVFGRPLEARIESLRELQGILGELHDCDVWLSGLPAADPAFAALRENRRRRRRVLHRRLVRWWEEHRQLWTWLRRRGAPS